MISAARFGIPAGVLFSLLLAVACVTDLRSRRIPNALVLALGLTGLGFALVANPAGPGAVRALEGAATGLAIWLPFWLLRKIGAGDVKLFAAAGLWLGPVGAVEAALVAALAGGILTLAWLLREQGLSRTVRALWLRSVAAPSGAEPPALLVVAPTRRVPYGLALAAGLAVVAWLPGLAS